MKSVALVVAGGVALAAPATAGERTEPASYLVSSQQPDGGFAEPGGRSDPALTAWVVLGLKAAGRDPAVVRRDGRSPTDYLADKPYPTGTDLALRILALRALGQPVGGLADQLAALRRADGRIGRFVNSTIRGVLALRAAGRPAGTSARYLLRRQHRSGGWSWAPGGAPDSNDTAAAIQALRAVRIGGKPIARGLVFLRRHQTPDGGFALSSGRPSDSMSTAWVIQAFVAARAKPPRTAFRFLARMRRSDGSFRYSGRYAVTPVWVTAQVLPALARRPFPLR